MPELVQVPMGTVDRIELIGSVQFYLPVARANAGLTPGEVVFQPHHIDASGLVNRRLIRLAEEGRIILSGPMSSAEAEAAARHQFNVDRYYRNIRAAADRRSGSGTTSSSDSADEFARMVGSSNLGSLPLGFQGNVALRWRDVADGRLGTSSCESSPAGGPSSVSIFRCMEFYLFPLCRYPPLARVWSAELTGISSLPRRRERIIGDLLLVTHRLLAVSNFQVLLALDLGAVIEVDGCLVMLV